jgi:hypothetical protein
MKTLIFLDDFDPFRNTVRHGGSLAVDLGNMSEAEQEPGHGVGTFGKG